MNVPITLVINKHWPAVMGAGERERESSLQRLSGTNTPRALASQAARWDSSRPRSEIHEMSARLTCPPRFQTYHPCPVTYVTHTRGRGEREGRRPGGGTRKLEREGSEREREGRRSGETIPRARTPPAPTTTWQDRRVTYRAKALTKQRP
jgi:hypothetical protein